MRINKITYIFILVLLMFTINVKADFPMVTGLTPGGHIDWTNPEEVTIRARQGDTISVYYYTNNWDDECNNDDYCAFKLATEIYAGIHYSEGLTFLSASKTGAISDWGFSSFDLETKLPGYNYIVATVGNSGNRILDGWNDIVKFDFKIDNNASDGIYTIAKTEDNVLVVEEGDDELIDGVGGCYSDTIRVVVGNSEPQYVAANDVPNNTYIIGSYMFTDEVSAVYNGQLTTQHIMRAAKSYESNELSSMIIYRKNARGVWKNAINNADITPPANFEIKYKDMVAYTTSSGSEEPVDEPEGVKFNGVYTNNGTSIKLYDLPNNQVSVLIESENSTTSATDYVVNGKISFDIIDTTYEITKSGNDVTFVTNSDEYPSGLYTKSSEYSMKDYYETAFYTSEEYLNDDKYNAIAEMTKDDEKIIMYMFKTDDDEVRVTLLDEDGLECSSFLFEIGTDGSLYDRDFFDERVETKITFSSDNKQFTLTEYNEDETIYTDSNIAGTYTFKEAITMEKIVKSIII